jgi:hypothetical protein
MITTSPPFAASVRPLPWQRRRVCPFLVPGFCRTAQPPAGSGEATDIRAAAISLRCLRRPGVDLAPDYAVDLCSGRYYPANSCVFYREPVEQA